MLRHYLLMALRGFMRHKLYSVINVMGLAVGLTCVIFAAAFIRYEVSYDKWIPDTGNLYRVELTVHLPGRSSLPLAVIPYPMPAAMRKQIPGVTGMTRLYSWPLTLTSGSRQFLEDVDVVDPDFFKLIRLPFVRGARPQVFRQPNSIVLSQAVAKQYFGDTDPIGRIVTAATGICSNHGKICPQVALRVTGVMRDFPSNTQLTGDAFIPTTSLANPVPQKLRKDWFSEDGGGYVRLAHGVTPARVVAALASIFNKDVTPVVQKYYGSRVLGGEIYKAHLTPFAQVHLDSSRWEYNLKDPGSWGTLYGVAIIGLLVLLVACFNFMNLMTARATLRIREVALRKILGASRGQVILQFLSEAVLVALLSLLLALAMAEVLLPLFDALLAKPITLHYARHWGWLLLLIGIAATTGLIGESYPALVLSALRPTAGLRAGDGRQARSGRLRNTLVFLQFSVSIAIAISALVVFQQVSYARRLDLGFDHKEILVIQNGSMTGQKQKAFAQALRADPGVVAVGLSSYIPFGSGQSNSLIQIPGQAAQFVINTTAIGPDYPKVYGIPLVAGRLLSAARGADRMHSLGIVTGGDPLNEGRDVLINAAAARRLGLTPDKAVGKVIIYNHNHVRVVGVLADVKLKGALERVVPMIYLYVPSYPMAFSVRLRPGRVPQTLKFIDRTWHAYLPTVAIRRFFLRALFDDLSRSVTREDAMLGILVVLAALIGCLGLYGLALFTAQRRTREIGIRKISGARTVDVVHVMLWHISIPVLMANLVAWPAAYLYLRHWLDGYAYRISLNPMYFVGAGVGALLIAWATVYGNSVRLARTNPIHALRYE